MLHVIMSLEVYILVLVFVVSTLAHYGEYVPKSFYVIDHDGHKSGLIYVRNRRELANSLFRMKRGGGSNSGGYSSSSAHASASSSASAGSGASGGGDRGGGGREGGGYEDFNPAALFPEFANFAMNFPAEFGGGNSGSGARSFGSSYSSGSGSGSGGGYGNSGSGNGNSRGGSGYGDSGSAGGYGNNRNTGGLGSGHQAGYDGPILFSRFGESEGTGIQGQASAQGPNAAFSSVSTSSENGKVKYNIKSGKY